jgi:hypothetical protein
VRNPFLRWPASWNPAGLIQLEKPEASVVYSSMSWKQGYHPSQHSEMNTSNKIDTSGINYAGYAYPFKTLDRNMVFSVNYQRLFELDKSSTFTYHRDLGGGDYLDDDISFVQKGYLYALSPALAAQASLDDECRRLLERGSRRSRQEVSMSDHSGRPRA